MTVLTGLFGFYWIPESPATGRWFTPEEKAAALARSLRDSSREVDSKFSWTEAFEPWRDWKMILFTIISLTYPVCWSTTSNFLPQACHVSQLGGNSLLNWADSPSR